MALPKPSDTPRSKPNPTVEENDSEFVGLESTQFKVFKTTLFKSLDTMIGRFTTLLTMKKTQDRLNEENALEASKPIADKKLKKSVGSTFSFPNALAFFAGALAVYLSDKIKETMNAIYEWADKTFTNFATPILNTLKVLPIIGPLFAAAHLMINTITNAKAHQFETEHDHDHDSIEDGDPFDLDGDDQILGTVLGDAGDTIKNIEITVDDIIDGLTKNGLDKIFNRPDIPEPDLDMPDVPEPPEGGNDTGFAPPPSAPVPEGGNDTGLVAPAPIPEGGNDSGLGAPAPAPAAPSSVAPPAPGPTRQRRRATTNPNRGDLPPVVETSPAASSSGASGTGGGAQPGQAGSGNAASPDGTETNESGPAVVPTTTEKPSNVGVESLANKKVEADMLSKANQDLLGRFYGFAKEYGKPVRINSGYRPDSYQAELWVRGIKLNDPGIYKNVSRPQKTQTITYEGKEYTVEGNNRGGSSHLTGNALDVKVEPGLTEVKSYTSLDNTLKKWGLRRPYIKDDPVHIELIAGTPALPTGDTQNTPGETPKAPPNVKYNQGTNASNVNPAPPFHYPAAPTPLAARPAR